MATNGVNNMTRLEELEMAITSLPEEDYSRIRRWFLDRDWEKWDREIEADAESGKLDFLRQEAAEATKITQPRRRSVMEQAVTAEYRWSAEDFMQANRYQLRHVFRPMTRFGLHLLFVTLLLGGIGGLLTYPKPNATSLSVQIGVIIAGVYWFFLRRYDFQWSMRRRYAKRPDKDSRIRWEIGPDKISVRSCLGYSEFTWDAILKVVRTPAALMLYSLGQVFYYLPCHGFSNSAEFEQVVELAKIKCATFYPVA
jgi:hypothetical protein